MTISKRYPALAFMIVIALAVAARPVLAQPGEGNSREVAARALFAEGRYREALELYVKLYAETAHPTYMRNIGRCYQNLDEPDRAIASFREYLRQATDLRVDQRATIERYIRETEEAKRTRTAQAAPGVPPPAAQAIPAPTPRATVETSAAPAADGGAVHRGLALGVGAVGVVALGVGTWFGLDARSQWKSATEMCPQPDVTGCSESARKLARDADGSALGATILISAGTVALAAGVIIWLTAPERPRDKTSARLRVVPCLGGVAGTF